MPTPRSARLATAIFSALLVAGCGNAAPSSDAVVDDASPETPPAAVATPEPLKCAGFESEMINDYVMGADGPADPMEAAMGYAKDGESVIFGDRTAKEIDAFVVNEDGETVGTLGLMNMGNGWLVGSFDQCSKS